MTFKTSCRNIYTYLRETRKQKWNTAMKEIYTDKELGAKIKKCQISSKKNKDDRYVVQDVTDYGKVILAITTDWGLETAYDGCEVLAHYYCGDNQWT